MKKIAAELIPLPNQVSTVVWNAWRHRKVGGSISVGVQSVGTSVCCDSPPSQHASKHAATTGHPIIASFEQRGSEPNPPEPVPPTANLDPALSREYVAGKSK